MIQCERICSKWDFIFAFASYFVNTWARAAFQWMILIHNDERWKGRTYSLWTMSFGSVVDHTVKSARLHEPVTLILPCIAFVIQTKSNTSTKKCKNKYEWIQMQMQIQSGITLLQPACQYYLRAREKHKRHANASDSTKQMIFICNVT